MKEKNKGNYFFLHKKILMINFILFKNLLNLNITHLKNNFKKIFQFLIFFFIFYGNYSKFSIEIYKTYLFISYRNLKRICRNIFFLRI